MLVLSCMFLWKQLWIAILRMGNLYVTSADEFASVRRQQRRKPLKSVPYVALATKSKKCKQTTAVEQSITEASIGTILAPAQREEKQATSLSYFSSSMSSSSSVEGCSDRVQIQCKNVDKTTAQNGSDEKQAIEVLEPNRKHRRQYVRQY